MKKLLIATTALVATAGVAAAEVKVTGDGRMGVVYGVGAIGNDDLNFSSRIRVTFTLSGQTDSGLSFGGSFRADNASGASNGSAGFIFISGAFGRLEMGNVVGAAEKVIGDFPEVGFQDLSSQGASSFATNDRIGQNEVTYLTGDDGAVRFSPYGDSITSGNPSALYTYTTGGLTFALSMNDGKAGLGGNDTQNYAVGVKYAFGDYAVSLGYEVSDPAAGASAKQLILGADAKFGDTTVKVVYGDGSGAADPFKQYGIGVTSKFDAVTVKGYIKRQEWGASDVTSWGLGGEYALGGGATLAGGIADNDLAGSKMVADFGIKFTF